MAHDLSSLVAVDIGNHRIKLGDFEHPLAHPLPHPDRAVVLAPDCADDELVNWLPHEPTRYRWSISSVNRPVAHRLVESLRARGVENIRLLTSADLPLAIEVARPQHVGMDRLANALAASVLRRVDHPAVVVGVGTAITVDLVTAAGAFAGGAILPGLDIAARALHEWTDLLPLVEVSQPEESIGRSTVEAIRFGLYWGAVGAIYELVRRLVDDPAAADLFVTGGGAPALLAGLRGRQLAPQHVPHLTLAGIALAERGNQAAGLP